MRSTIDRIVVAIGAARADRDVPESRPMIVATDGGSGAGKSTIAESLASRLQAPVIPMDDFFAIDVPDAEWDSMSVEERLAQVFDWGRLRLSVLQPLSQGRMASWRPIDFAAGMSDRGTYRLKGERVSCAPAQVIVLDGVYSAGPDLAEYVDFRVLVSEALSVRHARLAKREQAEFLSRWHALWDPVEAYYFTQICPPAAFDLIIGM